MHVHADKRGSTIILQKNVISTFTFRPINIGLFYPYHTYPDYLLIRTPVWGPISISHHKVTHLSGNSIIRTVTLGTEVSG